VLCIKIADWWRTVKLYKCFIWFRDFEITLIWIKVFKVCLHINSPKRFLDKSLSWTSWLPFNSWWFIIIELCKNQHNFGENQLKAKFLFTLGCCLRLRHQDDVSGCIPATVRRLFIQLHSPNSVINLFHCPTTPTNVNMSYTLIMQYS
jgi:hypothetical protein